MDELLKLIVGLPPSTAGGSFSAVDAAPLSARGRGYPLLYSHGTIMGATSSNQ
jgi:hypothetical protein